MQSKQTFLCPPSQVRQGEGWTPDPDGDMERATALDGTPSMARLSSNLEAIGLMCFRDSM